MAAATFSLCAVCPPVLVFLTVPAVSTLYWYSLDELLASYVELYTSPHGSCYLLPLCCLCELLLLSVCRRDFPSPLLAVFHLGTRWCGTESVIERAGIADEQRKQYGVQFHPEVDLTANGTRMLRNFLFEVCGLRGNYTMRNREAACIEAIKESVGEHKVLVSVGCADVHCRCRHRTVLPAQFSH